MYLTAAMVHQPNKIQSFLLAFVTLVAFTWLSGCSTDFEVNAPYQRVPVVYGTLDPSQPVQYVRVQRTFQNRGTDARTIAANNRDSSEFKPGEISVSLWRVANGEQKVGDYTPYESGEKLPNGSFYSPNHTIYRLNTPIGTLADGGVYKIRIKNNFTKDSSVQAVTNIVGPFYSNLPSNQNGFGSKSLDILPGDNAKFNMQFWANCHAKIINVNLRIRYREVRTGGQVDTFDVWQLKVVNHLEPTVRQDCNINRGDGSTRRNFDIPCGPVIQSLIDSIPPADANVSQRNFVDVQCYFYAYSTQVSDYQNVNGQFQPITQSVPTYTNISGGLGLFASVRSDVITGNVIPGLVLQMNSTNALGQPIYPKLAALRFR